MSTDPKTIATFIVSLSFLMGGQHASAQFGGLDDLAKSVIKPADSCAKIGGVVGDLLGDAETQKWSSIGSAAVCAVIAIDMEKRRKKAIKAEKKLDKKIAQQKLSIEEMRQENEKLKTRVMELQTKAQSLRAELQSNPNEAMRVAAEIKAEQEAVDDRVFYVDARIEEIDRLLRDTAESTEARTKLQTIRELEVNRRAWLISIKNITVS